MCATDDAEAGGPGADARRAEREAMVREQIEARGIADLRVLDAMRTVPRHVFVPPESASRAYDDYPLPLSHGQTISQPYIVAAMTELVRPATNHVVLEIGTGSGYQAAVLSGLVREVYTIEIVEPLGTSARQRLKALGCTNVTVRVGDGYQGWPARAPFDGIIVTAAPDHVPQPLVDQLRPGGRMVIPVGGVHDVQRLLLIEKAVDGTVTRRPVMGVRFVPLTRAPSAVKP